MQAVSIWGIIALGGAIGALARHGVGVLAIRIAGHGFPWGTLTVNIVGSFLMGLLIAWLAARSQLDSQLRLFAATGFLGAFTTFSAFSLDVVTLIERKAVWLAGGYALVSVIAAIAALFAGLLIGRVFA